MSLCSFFKLSNVLVFPDGEPPIIKILYGWSGKFGHFSLKNIDLLPELPFYDQLNIIKTDHAFSGYAMSYKVEIVDKKDLIVQLQGSKSSIKDLFNDLLYETKGFKYQNTVKVLLKKYRSNGEIEFAPVYFNSSAKITDIN